MFGFSFKSSAYDELTSAQFQQKIQEEKGSVILDVRTSGEFMGGHIPGALNIDIMRPDFNAAISKLDKSKTYLVYCRSGSRSAQACSVLAAKGYKAINLSGGIISWRGNVTQD
jgi:rhodanese-related sulfurtransferase